MIVGLDVSTSCVGIAILNDDGTLRSISHVDLKKEKNFYQKVNAVIDFMIDGLHIPGADVRFYVEAPLLHFKMKASMASTLALLQRFNACVCYAIFQTFRYEPKLISVISARKAVGISVPKKVKKKAAKQFVLDFIRTTGRVPESSWAFKKTGTPKDWCYDRADAYVIARAAYETESRQEEEA